MNLIIFLVLLHSSKSYKLNWCKILTIEFASAVFGSIAGDFFLIRNSNKSSMKSLAPVYWGLLEKVSLFEMPCLFFISLLFCAKFH